MTRLRLFTLMLLLAGCAAFSNQAHAQGGDAAIGLRLTPDGAGFTGKFFVDKPLAIEAQLNAGGIFAFEGESVTAVGLVEYHIQLPDPSWRLFFGGGAHIGTWDRDYRRGNDEFIFGLDAIGGVEYQMKNIPIAFSGDFKPAVNIVSRADFFPHNMFGAAARYYFSRKALKPVR